MVHFQLLYWLISGSKLVLVLAWMVLCWIYISQMVLWMPFLLLLLVLKWCGSVHYKDLVSWRTLLLLILCTFYVSLVMVVVISFLYSSYLLWLLQVEVCWFFWNPHTFFSSLVFLFCLLRYNYYWTGPGAETWLWLLHLPVFLFWFLPICDVWVVGYKVSDWLVDCFLCWCPLI